MRVRTHTHARVRARARTHAHTQSQTHTQNTHNAHKHHGLLHNPSHKPQSSQVRTISTTLKHYLLSFRSVRVSLRSWSGRDLWPSGKAGSGVLAILSSSSLLHCFLRFFKLNIQQKDSLSYSLSLSLSISLSHTHTHTHKCRHTHTHTHKRRHTHTH